MARTRSRNLVQDGLERVEGTFRDLEKDFQRLQKKADRRRRDLEKRATKEVNRLRTELRRSPVVKRAQRLGSEARRRIEEQVESLLGGLRIASQADVARLERKVSALNRKLRALEKRPGSRTRTTRAA